MDYKDWTMRFGKYKGQTLGDLAATDMSYLVWLEGSLDKDNKLKPAIQHVLGMSDTDLDVDKVSTAQNISLLSETVTQLAENLQDIELSIKSLEDRYEALVTTGELL